MKAKSSGASAPSGTPASNAAAHSAASHSTPADTTDWPVYLRGFGDAAALDKKRLTYEETDLIAFGRRISMIPTSDPDLYRALLTEELGPVYYAAMGSLAGQLHTAANSMPPKLNSFELLPPAQKDVVAEVKKNVQQARKMIFTCANSTGRADQTKALGRGLRVGNSFESVRTAGRALVSGAPQHLPLLKDARINQARIDRIADGLLKLDAVETGKTDRRQDKEEASTEIASLSHAIETGFAFLRICIDGAFEDDALGLANALGGNLPRAQDRRSPASGDAPPKTAKDVKKEKAKEKADEPVEKEKAAAEQTAADPAAGAASVAMVPEGAVGEKDGAESSK